MSLRFYQCGDGLRADGAVPYKIFPAFLEPSSFYVRVGLQGLGKFESQLEAIQACNAYERALT